MTGRPSIWDRIRKALGLDGFRGSKAQPAADPPSSPPAKVETTPTVSGPDVSETAAAPVPVLRYQEVQRPKVSTSSLPPVDLVLGIDLGTSCTKAVVGDPAWKNRSYPVRFTNSNDISSFLPGTRFGNELNLKMRLMDDPGSERVRDALACCLAGVVAKARDDFLKGGPPDYRRCELRWSLNLGFPGKSTNDAPLLAEAYRDIARTAVGLCSQPEAHSLELAARIRRRELACEHFLPESKIQLYPEIAAQLAGYITSPHRRHGPVLLVDVGAGTLDVSTIILHSNQDDEVVSFHCCSVRNLGALRLYVRRSKALEAIVRGCVPDPMERFQDGASPAPERIEEFVANAAPELRQAFEATSREFGAEVLSQSLGTLMAFRKRQREANTRAGFEPWGRNLRFFLTGGGSRSVFYRKCLVRDLEQHVSQITTCWEVEPGRRQCLGQGFRIEELPVPSSSSFPGFPPSLHPHFDRLSVAHGLAFGGQNLMKITSTPAD